MAAYTTNFVEASGLNVFYREAGPKDAPVILLLHGFPSSSHQYRNLIPLLSQKYHVIAPDLPGFGFTEVPAELKYKYTFDNLAKSIGAFLDALSIKKYSVYVFDYGAPTGFRLALSRPESIQAIISQNGNAYEEGLGDAWAPLKAYWKSGSNSDREFVRANVLSLDAVKWQYDTGSKVPIAPEAPYLDFALMQRPGNEDIQLDLFYDYQNNVTKYPEFHEYFRKSQVPTLVAWGKHDPFFIPPGAEAFKRDIKETEVHLLDAGHFAVESNAEDIAGLVLKFLEKTGI
ncbi:alpha/beta-hydrolase [Mollisia scopiformis]|uniref:Alpha/beta-hydrolase n=1 Tax=Mollisia scopiformis TaxID=149040 RepID=A0A194WWG4_MOLSC|nr:alpha/beta-hydrolase [Mollisia scopiformis]KUJ12290.1 alpha/beta-hydrolase [Mollisia scopiformis]